MRSVLLVSLAGCDALFRLAEVPPAAPDVAGDGDGVVIADAATGCIVAPFSGTTADLDEHWERLEEPGCMVQSAAGELVIDIGSQAMCYAGVRSKVRGDFENRAAYVRVRSELTGDNSELQFAMLVDASNNYMMNLDGGQILMRVTRDDQAQPVRVTYDAQQHAFWRIAHVPAAGSESAAMAFQTSPNAVTWVEHHRVSLLVPLDDLAAHLFAGAYTTPYVLPQAARFDDFTLCPL